MSNYVAKADIELRLDAEIIAELTNVGDDPEGPGDDNRLNACIEDAQAEVEGYLSAIPGLTIPLSNVPALIKTYMCDIVIFRLYQIKNADTSPDAIRTRYLRAKEGLAALKNGEMAIDAFKPASSTSSAFRTNSTITDRKFTEESMYGFMG